MFSKRWRKLRIGNVNGSDLTTYRYRIRITSMREHAEAVAASRVEFNDEGRLIDERSQEAVNLALLPVYVEELEMLRGDEYVALPLDGINVDDPEASEIDPYDAKLIADTAASFRLGVGRVVLTDDDQLPAPQTPKAEAAEETEAAAGDEAG